MGAINVKNFGLAVGSTFAIFRLLCIMVFMITSREQAILFFNSLLHGIDISPILRTEMTGPDMLFGLIQIFVLGFLAGATIASIYNFQLNCACCKKK